jgi:hypothetical protein
LILLLVTLGCDPGMTIYQTNVGQPAETVPQRITIQIKTRRSLIGENWYDPDATVTDLADKPVSIDKVELIADGSRYENERANSRHEYPFTVTPGKTAKLPIWFDLKHSVDVTFKTPAELRVYCRQGKEEFVQSTFIAGGPLDLKTPEITTPSPIKRIESPL